MAIAERDKSGRAKSRYSDLDLYEAVRVIAKFVDADDPESISQPAFDAARASAGHPDCPTARAVCMRLADRDRSSLPWAELLSRALDGEINRSRSHTAHRAAAESPYLGEEHLYFAVKLVARELGKPPTEDHYTRIRENLIARARRRGSSLITELMPTAGQLIRIADHLRTENSSWNNVLEIAKLPPASQTITERQPTASVPVAEAIDEFVTWNDAWPSRARLEAFIRQLNVRLKFDRQPWPEHIAEARRRRSERGESSPPGDGPKAPGYRYRPRPIKLPPELPAHWPLRGEAIQSEEACRDAVKQYAESLAKGRQPTKKGYMAYAAEHALPSHHSLDRYGGLKKLLCEVRKAS